MATRALKGVCPSPWRRGEAGAAGAASCSAPCRADGKGAPPLLRLTPLSCRHRREQRKRRSKGGGRPGQPARVAPMTSSLCAAAALSLAATAQEQKQDGEEPRVATGPCVGEACRRPCCGKEEPRPRVPPSALFGAAPGKGSSPT
jgi:hypothetical protein